MKPTLATILFVEDDPNDQFFIKEALREAGAVCPIHVVGDGVEAIAYMRGEGKYADREKICISHVYYDGFKNASDGWIWRIRVSQKESRLENYSRRRFVGIKRLGRH